MLIWKHLLMSSGFGMILAAAGILTYDLCTKTRSRKASPPGAVVPQVVNGHWSISLALVLLAWGPILVAVSLMLVPAGMTGWHVG